MVITPQKDGISSNDDGIPQRWESVTTITMKGHCQLFDDAFFYDYRKECFSTAKTLRSAPLKWSESDRRGGVTQTIGGGVTQTTLEVVREGKRGCGKRERKGNDRGRRKGGGRGRERGVGEEGE